MIDTPRTVVIATLALLGGIGAGGLGGCSLSPPERAVHAAPDRVGEVDPAALVGVWRVTPLNPYPDQGAQDTVIEYRADGTVVGQLDPGDDPAMASLGDVRFEMNARWTVADGLVRHDDVSMEAVSDNALARLMSGMINGAKRDLGGTADVLELDANRIVMLGDDGAAMRYDRISAR